MKISKALLILVLLVFFSAILLVRVQIGSYSTFHLWILGIVMLIFAFFNKNKFVAFFAGDSILFCMLFFLGIVLISYAVNISNADLVSKTYTSNSGESPPFLYGKITLNGTNYILITMLAYLLGREIGKSRSYFLKVYNFCIGLFLINATANVLTWLIVTKGSFSRYNFDPPITFSPGVSIQYSTIGFMLGLAALFSIKLKNKRRLFIVALGILLLSILIILTRQAQISFLIMVIWYFVKTQRFNAKTIFIVVPVFVVFLCLGLYALYVSGALSSYGSIDSSDSTDVAIRVLMLNSAYELFVTHPIFGIGYGMFVGYNTTPVLITGVPIYLASPHNGFAAITCELGSVGILMLLFISGLVISKLNRKLKQVEDPVIYRYCVAIYVIQVILMISVFISNSNLFGPPSELPYLYVSFMSWFMIGSVIGIKPNPIAQ